MSSLEWVILVARALLGLQEAKEIWEIKAHVDSQVAEESKVYKEYRVLLDSPVAEVLQVAKEIREIKDTQVVKVYRVLRDSLVARVCQENSLL